MSSAIRLAETPAAREVWRDVFTSDPVATVHQAPEWLDAICSTGGYEDASRLYESDDGRRLVLPMVRRTGGRSLLPAAESLPAAWGPGGLIASDGQLYPKDVTAILGLLVREPLVRVRIRPEHGALAAWQAAGLPPKVSVNPQSKAVIDLDGGFAKVWSRFKGAARTSIRKAQRSELVVESDATGALIPRYYDLYQTWARHRAQQARLPTAMMVRRAERAEPRRKYEAVAAHLGSSCRVWLAYHEGRAIAGAITLVHGHHLSWWRAVSDPVIAGRTSANDLLQQHMIEYACEIGCRDYNMGWSGTGSLHAFKEKFGARLFDYPVYTFDRISAKYLEETISTTRRGVKRLVVRK